MKKHSSWIDSLKGLNATWNRPASKSLEDLIDRDWKIFVDWTKTPPKKSKRKIKSK